LRLSSTDFTLSAWVKLDAQGGGMILAKRLQGDLTGWTWTIGNNQVYFGPGGAAPAAVGYATINTGLWYMITCVYTLSNQTLNIYINGVLIKSTTGIASPSTTIISTLYIGRDDPNTAGINYFFPGSMDDVRIYGRALPVGQIQKLYTFTN